MKHILFLGSLFLVMTAVAMTVPTALFNWNKATHDFGKIVQGKPVTAEFSFKNKGELPLVINRAQGSCGCTGVEYPKEAIMPGGTGTIKATFNAASLGAFNKTVVVESNAEGGMQTLYIKGEVLKEESTIH